MDRTWHPRGLMLLTLLLAAALTLVACGGRATPTPQPTNTAIPATNTPVAATNTAVPATNTPAPATDTPAPPTATTEPTAQPTTAATTAATAAAEPTTTSGVITTSDPASAAPTIPHTLEGRDDCALCHAPDSNIKPATERHTSLQFDNCLNCHRPQDAEVVVLQLVAAAADEAPTLDGVADETAWDEATAVTVPVAGGANTNATEVVIKSVYVGEMVYFLVTWADPTESFLRSPWEKQADGSWTTLKDPDDQGGDNNLWYEDKLAFIWDIGNSIPDFPTTGCRVACHFGEEGKPYGNKYTAAEGQMGDIWHWKSVRNLEQMDDQYLDHTTYSPDTPEAGRHGDPREGGGYVNNESEDRTQPAFMLPGDDAPKDGSPGYILDSEKVAFDDSAFEAGDRVPGIVKAPFTGDRGDLAAGWTYAEGVWTLEVGRALVTGSEYDVQFDDLTATYHFGVAVFENAQVRHSYQQGAAEFTFQPAQ